MSSSGSEAECSTPGRDEKTRLVLYLVVLLAVAAIVAVVWVGVLWNLGSDLREGFRLVKEQRYQEAEPFLQRALNSHPDDWRVAKAMAQSQIAQKHWHEALPYLSQWCRQQPENAEAFRQRMLTNIEDHNYPDALADALRVMELDPSDLELVRRLPSLYVTSGRLDEAELRVRSFLKTEPDDPQSLYLLAYVCHEQGKNAESAKALDRLLARAPTDPQGILLRGTLYLEEDQPKQAIPFFVQAAKLDQRYHPQLAALYQLALALARLGRRSEAEAAMSKALMVEAKDLVNRKEQPKVPALMLNMAEALVDVGQFKEAADLVKTVVDKDDNCTRHGILILRRAIAREPNPAVQALLAEYEKGERAPR
jgi:tetratricopeptide (TPR) repeat protein